MKLCLVCSSTNGGQKQTQNVHVMTTTRHFYHFTRCHGFGRCGKVEALPMFHLHWTRSLGWREELGTGLGRKLSLVTGSVPVNVIHVQRRPHVLINV